MSESAPNTSSNESSSDNIKKPPFFVFRLPPGFSFGEICLAPKAQPQVEISREEAIARCLRSGPPLLGLGRQTQKNDDEKNGDDDDDEKKNKERIATAPLMMMELQTSSGSDSSENQTLIKHAVAESKVESYSQHGSSSAASSPPLPSLSSTCPPVVQFHILHTGNFVRVATMPGRLYWLAQNASMHQSPDWKLHIACRPCDVAIVWNLVVLPVFFEHVTVFTVGMKAVLTATRNEETGQFTTTSGEEHWPDEQTGREVTVYLFADDQMYDENLIGEQPVFVDEENDECEDGNDVQADANEEGNVDEEKQQIPTTAATLENRHEPTSERAKNPRKNEKRRRQFDKNHLWVGDDPLLSDHWRVLLRRASNYSSQDLIHFVESIQQRMDVYQIPTRGCAAGDLPLTRSVSLRNEAYTCGLAVNERWRHEETRRDNNNKNNKMTTTTPSRANDLALMYPMNDWGWNAAAQRVPESLQGLIAHFNPDEVVEFSFAAERSRRRSTKGENSEECCC